MKIQQCCYSCDGSLGDCGEESSPDATWTEAKRTAISDGWLIDKSGHLCPIHRRAASAAVRAARKAVAAKMKALASGDPSGGSDG